MECYDRTAHVYYPHHQEHVVPHGASATNLGVCARCREITDIRVCVLSTRRGYQRAADALIAAGLMTAPRYSVVVTSRRQGCPQQTREVATYASLPEAQDRADEESRPLSREERAEAWVSSSAKVVTVAGQFLGRAATVGA